MPQKSSSICFLSFPQVVIKLAKVHSLPAALFFFFFFFFFEAPQLYDKTSGVYIELKPFFFVFFPERGTAVGILSYLSV